VVELQPDLILGNKKENVQDQIESLIQKELAVWMGDVATFYDALDMIKSVGTITNTTVRAQALINELTEVFAQQLIMMTKSVTAIVPSTPTTTITSQQQPDVAVSTSTTTTTTTASTTPISITAIYLIWRNPYMAVGHGTVY
jgi:ABC-type Fe3+-hydroxamate transport system substrate-binding protein